MGWLILSVFVWEWFSLRERVYIAVERFSPRVYIAVAFIARVLLRPSSRPFKIDIITFIFQVGRPGLSKFNGLQVGAPAVTTMYYSPFLQCSNPLPFCPDFLFRGLEFSLHSGVLRLYGYFAVVLVLLVREVRAIIIIHLMNDGRTVFLNGLVRHMLKTAQLLNRRPYHMAWISVYFVGWFVLRQRQAPDSVLPKWDYRLTAPTGIW